MHRKIPHSVLMMSVMLSSSAYAQLSCESSYGVITRVDGVLGQAMCQNQSQIFIDLVKNLEKTNPAYTRTSAAEVQGRFNDVDMTLHYAAHSNTLTFTSPELNIANQTFTGSTRKESQRMFTDWLKKSGVIGQIMNQQAKTSASSPITGAGGMMPSVSSSDFNVGWRDSSNIVATHNVALSSPANALDSADGTSSANTTSSSNNPSSSPASMLGLGLNVGSYSIDGSKDNVDTITLPLSYSFNIQEHSGQKIIVSLPITLYQVGKAKGYHGGVGLGYRYPLNDKWTLTPSVRYTLSASADRATVASVMSGSLMSTYTVPVGKFDVALGNMIGYYKTGKFKTGNYSFDPKIKQTMLRNGVMLSQPITLKGKKLAVEYSVIDTRYVGGNKPFLSRMQEYGVTVGLHKDEVAQNKKWSSWRGGITYMRGKNVKGFTGNVGYWF
ncbi:hypothetical protein [Alysiella filiformis]|uniref:Uncharacterized protein n=1 Tax=Alysiella filiformis DSM 16848 TaxID=1120981 RepID=A0A286EGZ9_9NEIS|nr:hypothetical protein [Alysiella filiformis]QMT32360.1 hypothetical protein H3L97_05910 [Alysiella filiformis]UBQ56720.1 hypothetical protein JF568_02780 [Alysiella filiformis DSM 16848]SOD70183.1 hypothetical protein SAMN02746062_02013 [Alysiella filiformis DSM 16848]